MTGSIQAFRAESPSATQQETLKIRWNQLDMEIFPESGLCSAPAHKSSRRPPKWKNAAIYSTEKLTTTVRN